MMTDMSELELLEFFEVEPERDEYLLTYTVGTGDNLQLLFRYNPIENYIETTLKAAGEKVMTTSHDAVSRMWIDGATLNAEFSFRDHNVRLGVSVRPKIHVEWVGLRTA
jgi:hypothetical protein